MLYGLMQSDGKIIRKEAELYKLLITATDKDGKRFNKKTSATVKVGDIVYRERYVSAIFECTCDTRWTVCTHSSWSYLQENRNDSRPV